ncbi:MAG: hypothetical protein HKP06_08150 [Flavobacteriaceae bacterium]|nr:hypothetical protein [Flavobacteriaceae bacterium]
MQNKAVKKNVVLGILFFLPVIFLLFLYPAKHNYNVLDTVQEQVNELEAFKNDSTEEITFKDNITVLNFLGAKPMDQSTAVLNLSQMIYGKFKGFKRFQIVSLVPYGVNEEVQRLKDEIGKYDDLKYWKFVYGNPKDILKVHESLGLKTSLNEDFASDIVHIIDKDRNLRGRLDDRSDKEKEKESPPYQLMGYDCISVDVLKNKMSDDMRVLFTEYRQKRKGNFDSSSRRAEDLKESNEED